MQPQFVFNLTFFAFLESPHRFPLNLVFRLDDQMETLLVRRFGPRVWN